MRRSPHLRVPAAAVLAVLAGACGAGGTKAASSPTTTTTTAGRGAALTAFRQCMASHGVTLPQRQRPAGGAPADNGANGTNGANGGDATATTGPGGAGQGFGRFNTPPPGVDPAKYQAALNACRSQLPAAGAGNAQFRTAFAAYVTCLRNHGVQTGDPSQGAQALAGVDRNGATFQVADQQCRALLPQRGTQSTTTTTQ